MLASAIPEHIDSHLRQYLEAKYSAVAVNDKERMMEVVVGLMESSRDQGYSLPSLLDHVARQISRSLAIAEVVIGLYDRKDNTYYNEVVFGYKNNIAIELKKLRYSNEDIVDWQKSQRIKIGKLSEFSRVRGLAKAEQKVFDGLSTGPDSRRFADEYRRRDFIHTWMRDSRMGLVGWIRVSHRHDSRLPPKINVLWLELIASIFGCVISQRWHQEDQGRRSANG